MFSSVWQASFTLLFAIQTNSLNSKSDIVSSYLMIAHESVTCPHSFTYY